MSIEESIITSGNLHTCVRDVSIEVRVLGNSLFDTMAVCLESYGISRETGFIPSYDPSRQLNGVFEEWEELARQVPRFIAEKTFRMRAGQLKVIPEEAIDFASEREWWRAYVVITYICQAYIWSEGDKGVVDVLPRHLAVPWCRVSRHLGVPPIITHSTCLFNWKGDIYQCGSENLKVDLSFTGTADESWFFTTTLLVEMKAAKGIAIIPTVFQLMEEHNNQGLAEVMRSIEEALGEMHGAMFKMKEHCKPAVFYSLLRPFLAGWKSNDALPSGLIYEGVDEQPQMYNGGNAGQSSSIQAIDILLGLRHEGKDDSFIKEQRLHMPRKHRLFLEWLEEQPSLRQYIIHSNQKKLKETYNQCIKAIEKFRSGHIQIVALYILAQKNKVPGQTSLKAKGTAGSGIMPFLKKVRQDCVSALLDTS